MACDLLPRGAVARRRRLLSGVPGMAASLALGVIFCPAGLWSQEPVTPSQPAPPAATSSNFRTSSDAQSREMGLRPEEPVPTDLRAKERARQMDMSRERLDPFYEPPTDRTPGELDPEMEPGDAENTVAAERAKERAERARARDLVDEMSRTPEVDQAALFRASLFPRNILDVPSDGLASGLMRLSEEASLLGKPWTLNYGVFLSAIFDDNINLSSTDKQSDVLLTGGLNLSVRLGSDVSNFFLTGVYGISYGGYLNGTSDSVLGQNLGLSALYRFSKLTLGLNLGGSYGAGGTVDTAERTDTGNYFASLTANYAFSDKLAFNVAASTSSTGYENLLSSQEFRLNAFLDYTFSPKLSVGLGGGYGQMKAEEGSSQAFQQALIRASYTATAKLSVRGNFGLERTETEGGSNVTPIFGIGMAYQPFDRTTFSMDLSRQVYTSAVLEGQDYTSTSAALAVRQQLFPRLGVAVSVGYQYSEYFGAQQGIDASRTDKYLFIRTSADWEVARWCSMGAFYEFSNSESSGEGARPFSRNRIGLQVSIMF